MIRTILLVLAVVLVLAATQAIYIVGESEQTVLTQFGKPIGTAVTTPGPNIKAPFVQTVHRFDKRFLEWDGERNQLPTRDKRFIFVDTYARWRISDPLKFFQRLRDERGAQSRLDDILDGETRNVIARHDLIEVVRSSSREFAIDDEDVGGLNDVDDMSAGSKGSDFVVLVGRQKLAEEVLTASQARTEDLGIEILDFRFKRINYVEAVRTEVYNRMISERRRIAEQFRSQGTGEAARINGEQERELARITSEAFREAELIRGKADATAADIYADAYNANPELYAFLRSLETYEEIVDDKTTLMLGSDSDLFQYLETASP
ncbi:MAG: protease modulator HflC [Deltaproteobacteria bacterium]|nr:protease modulator HflC [Deltaproteobacteria bacterium]